MARIAQKWFAKFRFGNLISEDEHAGETPPASENERLMQLVEQISRKTVKELAKNLTPKIQQFTLERSSS